MVVTKEVVRRFEEGKTPEEVCRELSGVGMKISPKRIKEHYAIWRMGFKNYSEYKRFLNDDYFREIYEQREISGDNPYILLLKIIEIKKRCPPEAVEEVLARTPEYRMLERKTAGMTNKQKIKYFGRLARGLNILKQQGKIKF